MWQCRDCGSSQASRSKLLKHIRLEHGHYGGRHTYPCAYSNCPCTFKTWNALRSHLYRLHGSEQLHQNQISSQSTVINCHVCAVTDIPSVNDYFLHINNHLRIHETVSCMFKDCSFKTNVYGTFRSHKSRKHCQCSVADFKEGIVKTLEVRETSNDTPSYEETESPLLEDDDSCTDTDDVSENLPKLVELKFASLLLKLENHYHVPSSAVDELCGDLHYLLSDASLPLSQRIIVDTLQRHKIDNDALLVKDLVTSLSTTNPLLSTIKHGGPLASAFKRKQYYRDNFKMVDPVEYVLEAKGHRTFQYVPILESLQKLLCQNDLLDKMVESHISQPLEDTQEYRSIRDGLYFKANDFFSEELRISVCLYVDDFEICNPLGTSRKKHKLCAIYWILGNVPSVFQSTLSSIFLAVLCKTEDVKTYGFEKILQPLLQDLQTLEQQASRANSQTTEVKRGEFKLRTAEEHQGHVKLATEKEVNVMGVKKPCVFSENLSYFNVTTGYPPDLAHDLFEDKFDTMATSAKLLVIFGENNCERLNLPAGIPDTLNDLKQEIQTQLGVFEDFRLQLKDPDFNEFVNLSSTLDLQDRATLKIIFLPSSTSTSSSSVPERNETCSVSSCDTDIISSPQSSVLSTPESASSVRSQAWPDIFPIPQFNFDAEIQLQKAQLAYQTDGTVLSPNSKLKSDILDALASEIIKFKAYPSSADLDDVAAALIQKHPCLKERGSVSGYYGWKISLKYKMANYRTKLRNIGCSEVNINSHKRKGSIGSPNQVKKPRKAEVNYCPDYPVGDTKETLENLRITLLSEVTKRNNEQVIKGLMDRTFAQRRHEVVEDSPFITEFKNRWPGLFTEREVSAEFSRITTIPLVSKFMGQLDHFSTQLITIFKKKGGTTSQKITEILSVMDQSITIEKKRECILKALVVYLNEDPSNLVKEYMDTEHDEAEISMSNTTLGIYAIKHEGAGVADPYEDVGVIVEGIQVLENLDNVANACSMIIGLIYALNLAYPKDLRYTFEWFQKIFMELDANKLSNKVQVLKNKLLS